jgi:hypothetical protein
MTWEKRGDIISYLGLAFVAGWICCQSYYGLSHLWQERNQLAQTAATAICTDQYLDTDCKKVSPKAIPQVAKIVSEKTK